MTPTATEALAADAADGRTEGAHKAALKAELMLESLAKVAHRADPDRSYEQHYVRQLSAHPELAALLD